MKNLLAPCHPYGVQLVEKEPLEGREVLLFYAYCTMAYYIVGHDCTYQQFVSMKAQMATRLSFVIPPVENVQDF